MAHLAWLSVGEAAAHMQEPEQVVRRMAIRGALHSRLNGPAWELCGLDVQAFAQAKRAASELATRTGDVLAEHARIPVRQGPRIGDEAEQEFTASQDDYDDTPNDEGDEEQ